MNGNNPISIGIVALSPVPVGTAAAPSGENPTFREMLETLVEPAPGNGEADATVGSGSVEFPVSASSSPALPGNEKIKEPTASGATEPSLSERNKEAGEDFAASYPFMLSLCAPPVMFQAVAPPVAGATGDFNVTENMAAPGPAAGDAAIVAEVSGRKIGAAGRPDIAGETAAKAETTVAQDPAVVGLSVPAETDTFPPATSQTTGRPTVQREESSLRRSLQGDGSVARPAELAIATQPAESPRPRNLPQTGEHPRFIIGGKINVQTAKAQEGRTAAKSGVENGGGQGRLQTGSLWNAADAASGSPQPVAASLREQSAANQRRQEGTGQAALPGQTGDGPADSALETVPGMNPVSTGAVGQQSVRTGEGREDAALRLSDLTQGLNEQIYIAPKEAGAAGRASEPDGNAAEALNPGAPTQGSDAAVARLQAAMKTPTDLRTQLADSVSEENPKPTDGSLPPSSQILPVLSADAGSAESGPGRATAKAGDTAQSAVETESAAPGSSMADDSQTEMGLPGRNREGEPKQGPLDPAVLTARQQEKFAFAPEPSGKRGEVPVFRQGTPAGHDQPTAGEADLSSKDAAAGRVPAPVGGRDEAVFAVPKENRRAVEVFAGEGMTSVSVPAASARSFEPSGKRGEVPVFRQGTPAGHDQPAAGEADLSSKDAAAGRVPAPVGGRDEAVFAVPKENRRAVEVFAGEGMTSVSVPTAFARSFDVVSAGGAPAHTVAYVPREIIAQIVRGARILIRDGAARMQLKLEPPELGRVELRIAVEQDGMKAHFIAESQTVKAVIETNLPHLRNALQQAGIQADNISVSVGGKWSQGGFGGFAGRDSGPFYSNPQFRYTGNGRNETEFRDSETVNAFWIGRINIKA